LAPVSKSPLGQLDIGGEAPEKIVLSIVFAVAAILSGFLRERRSEIYPIVAAAGGEAA